MKLKVTAWKAALSILVVGLSIFFGAVLVVNQTTVDPKAIQSSVIRTHEAIESAWKLPVAVSFHHEVYWQSNPSMCGPASLANVFRSLGEPARTEQAVLAGTHLCWTGFCILGLTLDEVARVARSKTQRSLAVIRDITAEEFHEHLKQTNDPNRRYVVNFTRKSIFGAGAGHHSPIGGYLEAEDLVFVLDVSRIMRPGLWSALVCSMQ
jgi:hypothetical protein